MDYLNRKPAFWRPLPLTRAVCRVLLAGSLFASLPAWCDNIVIGVIGDYGAAYQGKGSPGYLNERAVANLVKSWQPDFIITVGDNNYPTNGADTIDINIGQFYHEYIYPYRGAFGAGATSNRFFPCIGNHDWAMGYFGTNGLTPYLDYFTLPGNEHYYNYRYGNVEIFCVASDQIEPDGATASSTQALWLSNALAASTAPWRLVYFHESPYSSGYWHGTWTHQSTNMLWPFREWGASVILCGHDHLYERILADGLTYFIVGTGGDRLDAFQFPMLPNSLAHYNASHGALRIDATETNLLFRFYNTGRRLIDTFEIKLGPKRLRPGGEGGG